MYVRSPPKQGHTFAFNSSTYDTSGLGNLRPDVEVLRGLSLQIPAGQRTALVGASGCGKSTIVGLLERWYNPTSGAIRLDGVETNLLNLAWLRTQIRLVQQEPVLFSGTIFENIAYGLVGTPFAQASYDEQLALVKKACQDAHAEDFICGLPDQYNTRIGERARMLSGGQKQRIAIARSIVSQPSILLLDEATSALDARAETLVQKALDNISVSRTTVVIAHKLSTVQKAENIAVVHDGRIIEQDTHHDLVSRDGAYAALVRAQDLDQANQRPDRQGWQEDNIELQDSDDDPHLKAASLPKDPTGTEAASSPGGEEAPGRETMTMAFPRLCSYSSPSNVSYGLSMAVSPLLASSVAVIFAQTFQIFQEHGEEAARSADFWALMFFIVALANLVLHFFLGWAANLIIQVVSRTYRREVFRNTVKQDIGFFDLDQNATGAISSRLLTIGINLNDLLGINFGLILINCVTVVSVSILGIAYGWKLGLVCVFAALLPLLLSGYARVRLEHKLEDDTSARFAHSSAIASESISAIRTVASFTLERSMLQRYKDQLDNVASRARTAIASTMLWYALSQSITFLAMALGFWYGGKLVSRGEYGTQQFFAVFMAVVLGGENAASLFNYSTSVTKAVASANYIFWLRQRRPAIDSDFADKDISVDEFSEKDQSALTIESKALGFSYPSRPSVNVISGIDMHIEPRTFVAIVGSSGCGKSTMVNLLARFYDPTSGCITINEELLHETDLQHHRSRLALVSQEPVLYEGSIRENVAMGLLQRQGVNAEGDSVEKACIDANVFDFASSLPDGLDTAVGARGCRLSGGQRQRVAIARALAREPKLLLLDEATSALDTQSERQVQQALDNAKVGGSRITVAVAHRLSTVRDADRIFVFHMGRIVESGTHAQLLEKRGVYFDMCKNQALDKALE